MSRRRGATVAVLAALALAAPLVTSPPASADPPGLTDHLARAFRSEAASVDLDLDYLPGRDRLRGTATLDLTLRHGQTRALFHFNPVRRLGPGAERAMLRGLTLDGEELDPADAADLRRVRPARGAEPAFEVQRDLAPGSRHTLVVSWSGPVDRAPDGWFYPKFDDTEGPRDETETAWPTVSSPEVLARHTVRLTVHSARPYAVMGGGDVSRVGERTWTLDTGRAVSSSNVFLAAVPRSEVRRSAVDVDTAAGPVTVRFVTDRSRAVLRRAEDVVRETVPEMVRQLGAFPVPSVDVLLTGWGSGMEYYRATRTGLGSLRHELGHMYFGTTTVNRTWRDTWFDESAVVWRQAHDHLDPVPRDFRSDIGGGRPPAAPGFDTRAYGAGARVLESIARVLGGDRAMLDFLADLQERRRYQPFTTDDLVDDVVAAQDRLGRARLERWLLGG